MPCLVLAGALLVALGPLAPPLRAQGPPPILVTSRHIVTRPGETLSGAILIEDGRIKEVGPTIAVPEGARVIDAGDRTVISAWIDARNDTLLDPDLLARSPSGYDHRVGPLLQAFDPRPARRLLKSGVGVVYGAYASETTKGMTGALVLVDPEPPTPPVLVAVAGIEVGVGARGRSPTSSIATRVGTAKALKSLLDGGKRYKESWEKYEKEFKEYEEKLAKWKTGEEKKDDAKSVEPEKPKTATPAAPSGFPEDFRSWPREKRREFMRKRREELDKAKESGDASTPPPSRSQRDAKGSSRGERPKPPKKPKVDPEKAAVQEVVDRKARLRIVAHWKQDIEAALEAIEDHDVDVVLVGASEAWRLLDRLAEAKIKVVLEPSIVFGGDHIDRVGYRPTLPSELAAAGIDFAFMTAGVPGYGGDDLALVAELAVAAGLSEDRALEALTTGAASVLGAADRFGRIAVGQTAAIQILSGLPLDPETTVEQMIIGDRIIVP